MDNKLHELICGCVRARAQLPAATLFTMIIRYRFPETIPVGTAVPAWAYLDVTTSNDWNLTTAKNYAAQNKTEITNPSSTSSTSSTSMSSTSSGSASPTATTAPTTHTSKKTNVGAIVGGVVGGVCGAVLLLLALLFWYRRRKAQRRPPSAQFRQPSPVLIAAPWTPDAEKRFSPGPTSPVSIGRIYVSTYCPVLCRLLCSDTCFFDPRWMGELTYLFHWFVQNPDDPSTFPDAQPPVNSIYSQSTRGSAVFSAQNGYQPAGIRYNGPAEL